MSDCRHAELLSGFIDDQLTAEQTATLLDHVGGCDSCRNDLEALVAIHDALRSGEVFADAAAPSADFVARVMEQLPHSPVAYEPERPSAIGKHLAPLIEFFRFRPVLAGAAMAAVLVAVGSTYFYPFLTQSSLQKVSEIKPQIMATAEPAERDIYYHARLNAAYTVGGTPLPIDHTLEERF